MASRDVRLSQDEVFDLLSNQRRRYVINYLLREDRPVSIQELSRELAMWEFDVDAESLTDQQEKRIYVALYQTHIPKLEDAGVVTYDSDAGIVEISDEARQLQPYLAEDPGTERPWGWYYLLVGATGLALFLAVELVGVDGDALVSFGVGVAALGAILLLAAYHYLSTR